MPFIILKGTRVSANLYGRVDDRSENETGRIVVHVGIVFQVVSLLIFMMLWLEVVLCLRRASESAKDVRFVELRDTKKFTWSQYALGGAVVLIFIHFIELQSYQRTYCQ